MIYGRFDSQTKLAEVLGWSKQRVSKISSGKKEPTIREAYKLAEVLEIDIAKVAEVFVQYWSHKKDCEK